jgi:hypothetical protein
VRSVAHVCSSSRNGRARRLAIDTLVVVVGWWGGGGGGGVQPLFLRRTLSYVRAEAERADRQRPRRRARVDTLLPLRQAEAAMIYAMYVRRRGAVVPCRSGSDGRGGERGVRPPEAMLRLQLRHLELQGQPRGGRDLTMMLTCIGLGSQRRGGRGMRL